MNSNCHNLYHFWEESHIVHAFNFGSYESLVVSKDTNRPLEKLFFQRWGAGQRPAPPPSLTKRRFSRWSRLCPWKQQDSHDLPNWRRVLHLNLLKRWYKLWQFEIMREVIDDALIGVVQQRAFSGLRSILVCQVSIMTFFCIKNVPISFTSFKKDSFLENKISHSLSYTKYDWAILSETSLWISFVEQHDRKTFSPR